MAYPSFTAASVMDQAAVLNNDAAKTRYTYTVQIPYLNQALKELQEYFELNNIPVTDTFTSDPITVLAGQTSIGFAPDSPIPDTPYLPDNLVEPKLLWERLVDVDPYYPMGKVDFLDRALSGVAINWFRSYTWQSQEIRFLPANQDNQIKMDYIRFLFEPVTAEDDELSVINSESYLQYRTAGLLARFIGENPTRADSLDSNAGLSMDRVVGIGTKGRQNINVRHRPFRQSYKSRTYS